METSEDLAVLAKKCNPLVGFFDPLGLAEQSFWDTTPEATIGFLREAEIKHGRIAMFVHALWQRKNLHVSVLLRGGVSLFLGR